MSITKETVLWCDQCSDWIRDSVSPTQLRKECKRKGWTRNTTYDNDLCPKCSKKALTKEGSHE
jgi:hypothetical protein